MTSAVRLVTLNAPRLDPATRAYQAYAASLGSPNSGATLAAIDRRVRSLKGAGLWSLVRLDCRLCGPDLGSARIQWSIDSAGGVTFNQADYTAFLGGDFTEATGLQGNSTTKYVRTGLLASTLSAADRHLSVYQRVAGTAAARVLIGASDGAYSQLHAIGVGGSTSDIRAFGGTSDAAGQFALQTGANVPGYLVNTQTSSTSVRAYLNGGSQVTQAVSAAAPPARQYYALGNDTGGSAGVLSDATIAGYTIGLGLTPAQALALYEIEQAFQAALGRAV